MRYFTLIIPLFLFNQTYGQKSQCFCDNDTLMNDATVNCDTTKLKNNSRLYWQFNCERVWLTLENANGKKFVIDEVDIELYAYTYRLGYHLIKEYKSSLLFRSGCSANGPCFYTLIDKTTGKKIKEFNQLICIDTDAQLENEHAYNYEFVVYFSQNTDHLVVYYVDSKRSCRIPFTDTFTNAVSEHQFDKMILQKNILTIFYENDDKKKTIRINLNNKKYCR
jgi:hypothetical protein